MSELSGTLDSWAKALGKSPQTIKRRLVKSGIDNTDNRAVYTAKQVFMALNADSDADARRKLKAEADLAEQEAARDAGNTFDWEETKKTISDAVVLPLSQFINNIPGTYSTRANPLDELLARQALEQLVSDLKKLLRENLPKPNES